VQSQGKSVEQTVGVAERSIKFLGLSAKIRVVCRSDIVYKSEWPGDEAPLVAAFFFFGALRLFVRHP
jgi:hypothetical protein